MAEFLTGAEVCARFRISPQTLSTWRRDGEIRAYKLGPRTYRYSAEEIEQYVEHAATDRSAS